MWCLSSYSRLLQNERRTGQKKAHGRYINLPPKYAPRASLHKQQNGASRNPFPSTKKGGGRADRRNYCLAPCAPPSCGGTPALALTSTLTSKPLPRIRRKHTKKPFSSTQQGALHTARLSARMPCFKLAQRHNNQADTKQMSPPPTYNPHSSSGSATKIFRKN